MSCTKRIHSYIYIVTEFPYLGDKKKKSVISEKINNKTIDKVNVCSVYGAQFQLVAENRFGFARPLKQMLITSCRQP